ncbi:DUF5643 domain-containing protein [Niallia sp. 03190]|uniref:DUF5643 domain-containing protein n=1 Tax=Niallia sp. 03190 TaxID=3458061 RepID=UPI004044D08A
MDLSDAIKILFSPLSTRIDLTIDYPAEMDENDTWPWFEFSVVDDTGKVYEGIKLQEGMAGNNGRHMILVLPPMDNIPQSLTFKPKDVDNKGQSEEIKDLELVVSLDKLK